MKNRGGHSFVLLAVALSFVFGVLVAGHLWLRMPVGVWLSMLLTALVPTFLLYKYQLSQSFMIWVCFFCLGGWLCSLHIDRGMVKMPQGYVAYEAVVSDCPKADVCELKIMRINVGHMKVPFKVRAKVDSASHLRVGDGIVASSRLYGIHRPRNADDFYPRYLLSHGFTASTRLYPGYWQKRRLSTDRLSMFDKTAILCRMFRDRLLQKANQTRMSASSRALLYAMTVGDRSLITSSLREDFSRSGVAHVLALSGLHFGMVYGIFLLLLHPWRRKVFASVLILLAVWAYAFFVGLSPSVLRTSTMLTVYALLDLDYRPHDAVSVLSFVAMMFLLFNPLMLYDVSFQLSFASVLSILLFYPLLGSLLPSRFLYRHRFIGWPVSLGVLSIAAQLGTAPLVAYHFGTFSTYFLLANYVAIPIVMLAVYLGFLFFLTLGIPCINAPVSLLLDPLLQWLASFTHWVNALPGSTLGGMHPAAWQVAGCYMLLALVYYGLRRGLSVDVR